MEKETSSGSSGAAERLFTVEEANRLLPRVRTLVEAIQQDAGRLAAVQQRLAAFREQKRRGDHAVEGEAKLALAVLGEANQISEAMRRSFGTLHEIGCEIKDVQQGLVDFRTRREDRTVYLCWRLGEDEIRYWHELDTGFAARQPL
jgi:hypothetical protein